MIEALIGLSLGISFVLGVVILLVILININRLIGYRRQNIWVRLDWFVMFRYFVYALILIFGSLYLL